MKNRADGFMIDQLAFERAVAVARQVHTDTGYPPTVDDVRLNVGEFALWWAAEGEEPLFELVRHQQGADPATRAVVGATLYFLAFGESDPEARDMLASATRRLLESQPIRDVEDLRLLTWEIHLAAAVNALDRVLAIARRLDDLDASLAHFALIAKAAFWLVHPASEKPLTPNWFHAEGEHSETDTEIVDLLTYSLATVVEPRSALPWTDPKDFAAATREAVFVIDTLLSRLNIRQQGLTPTQRGMKAWCVFAQGASVDDRPQLAEAAAAYLSIPRHTAAIPSFDHRRLMCGAATACYGRALRWPDAVAAAKEWCEVAPTDANAHRRLAECLYKDHRIPEAIQAYEAYVRLRKEGENDWEPSLLLRLGLEFEGQRQIRSALESAAFANAFRPQGEALLTWFSEWFPKLTAKARERWWVGMFTVSSPHVAVEIGEARWDQAADCFGEAVAFELKDSVFRPFAASNLNVKGPDKHWRSALTGNGMLGEMIEILLQARVPQHPAARELRGWLDSNRPAFPKHLSKVQPHQLLAFAKLRGQAQHASVNETQARQVYSEAVELLKALTTA